MGTDSGSGGLHVSFDYSESDSILGSERDFVFTPENIVNGLTIRDLECPTPNIQVSSATPGAATTLDSALSASAVGTANTCDLIDGAAIYPEQTRHSVYAGQNQELGESS